LDGLTRPLPVLDLKLENEQGVIEEPPRIANHLWGSSREPPSQFAEKKPEPLFLTANVIGGTQILCLTIRAGFLWRWRLVGGL